MDKLRLFLFASLCALLAGCASAPVQTLGPAAVLHDELFKPPSAHIETESEIFAASPAMQNWLATNFSRLHRTDGDPRQALVDALSSMRELRIDYDATYTRDAAEAFDARSGNCLSLVVMTAALARELNMPVQFQKVYIEDSLSRDGDLLFMAGHVNLTLSRARDAFVFRFTPSNDDLMVDFVPPSQLKGAHVREIDARTVAAMFLNNRAAEALDSGRIDDAYWWARAALIEDPHYTGAYNTLGVVYRRHGDLAVSEASLRRVLAAEPDSLAALGNLALVLRLQGRTTEAQALDVRMHAIQPYPPFHFFDLGVAAMKAHDYQLARNMFRKEISREAFYHEFHFWLALADYGLGDFDDAREQIQLALENSPTSKTHALYAAKLDWLNAHGANDAQNIIRTSMQRDGLPRGQ